MRHQKNHEKLRTQSITFEQQRKTTLMALESISSLWRRICAGLSERVPKEYLISRGVSESQIRKAERALGHRLPSDVREFYSIQNGIPGIEIILDVNIGFCLPLVPLKKKAIAVGGRNVVEQWRFFNEFFATTIIEPQYINPKGPITKTAWTPDWVPVFDNIQGDYVFLDLNPPKRGTYGQMIDWERPYDPRRILFRSFREFLTQIADGVNAKRFVVEESNFSVILAKKSTWNKMKAQER